jgi:PAS domain S-box-containing protein
MIKILLVDHALEAPLSIRRLLSAACISDFKVDCAVTYREILKGFNSRAYDVCLIDATAGNGFKLFAQARSVGCTAPIVLVTSGDIGETIEAIRNGVADCLVRNDLSASRIERSICYVVEQARSISLQTQRERRYLALLDNANEIIYTHDLEGNFTSMNTTGEQTLGYSEWEILKLNVLQVVGPKYRQLVQTMIEQTLDAQTQKVDEIELVTKNGRNLIVEAGTHPIYQQGRVIEVQWRARSLFASVQPEASFFQAREGPPIHTYPLANNFSLQPAPIGQSQFSS